MPTGEIPFFLKKMRFWVSNFHQLVPVNFLDTVPLDFHDRVPPNFLHVVPRHG